LELQYLNATAAQPGGFLSGEAGMQGAGLRGAKARVIAEMTMNFSQRGDNGNL
jgi:hypothetical protein